MVQMPDGGLSRRWPAAALTAVFMMLFTLAAVPAPAQALYGEITFSWGEAFTITYYNTTDKDVVWWQWDTVGGKAEMTFRIWKGDIFKFNYPEEKPEEIIYQKITTAGSDHFHLIKAEKIVVAWTHKSSTPVTLRYHVTLNPPDLTVLFSLAAILLLAPVVVIGSFILRERRHKARPDSSQAGK